MKKVIFRSTVYEVVSVEDVDMSLFYGVQSKGKIKGLIHRAGTTEIIRHLRAKGLDA